MSCKRIIIAALLAAPVSAARVDDEQKVDHAAPKKKATALLQQLPEIGGSGDEALISQSILADHQMNVDMQQRLAESSAKARNTAGPADAGKQAIDEKITKIQSSGTEAIQHLQDTTAGRIYDMQRKAQLETRAVSEKEESESNQKSKEVQAKAQVEMKQMLDGAMSEILQAKERSNFEVHTADDKAKAEIEGIESKGKATIDDAKIVGDLQKTQTIKKGKERLAEIEIEKGNAIGKLREEAQNTKKMKIEEIHAMSEKSVAKIEGEADIEAKKVQLDGERKVQALIDEVNSHHMEVARKIQFSDKESFDRVHNVEKETAHDIQDIQKMNDKTVKQIKEESQQNIDLKIKNVKVSTAAEMHQLDKIAENTMTDYQEKGTLAVQQTKQETKQRLDLIENKVKSTMSDLEAAQKLKAQTLSQSTAQALADFEAHKCKVETQTRVKEQELLHATMTAEHNTKSTIQQGDEHVKKMEEASACRIGQIKSATEATEKRLKDNAKVMSEDEEAMIKTGEKVKAEEMKTVEHTRSSTDKKIEENDHKTFLEVKRLEKLADQKIQDTQLSASKEMKMADCNAQSTMIQKKNDADARIVNLEKASDAAAKSAAAFQAKVNSEMTQIKGDLRSHVDQVKHDAEVVVHEASVQADKMVEEAKAKWQQRQQQLQEQKERDTKAAADAHEQAMR